MADVKISELTAQASANVDVSADVLALVDTSATQTKKISVENLLSPITIDKSAGTITALGTVTGNVDLNGAVQIDATFTSGVDGQGYDTKFFGDTSNAYMMWDTSEDALVFGGSAVISTQDATVSGVLKANGGAVFNEDSADVDFRVESNGATHMLFVDGGNNRIGINESSPNAKLDIDGDIQIEGANALLLNHTTGGASDTYINSPSSNNMGFRTGGTLAMTIDSSQNSTFAGTINSTIANTQTHSENTEPNSTTEFLTLHNNSGSDGAHTDKYVTMKMAVGSGAASEGHLIYRSSADNQGEFIFNSRHAGSTYNDILTLKSDKSATFAGDVTVGDSSASDYVIALRGGVGGFLGWDDSANTTILQAPNTRALSLRVNSDTFGAGTEAMSISSSGNTTFAGNITQSKAGNLRLTQTATGSGESSIVLTANNSTGDSFVRWETNSTTFCLGLDNSDGDKFILSAGSDPHSNSVINIQPDGSSIAIDKPTSFGSKIDFTGSPNMGNRIHSVQVASGATSTCNMNGAGGNCSGGFIVGACHRNASLTADNSVIIMAHLHTQGANVYTTILERNDDSDVTITRSGGNLTCTNNGNSTVNFVVKYILLTGFDTSNNLV